MGAGAKGIVATGSVGEFSHLTEAEREHVMDISLGQIRKNEGTKAVSMTAAAGHLGDDPLDQAGPGDGI